MRISLIICLLLCGCMTENKVNNYLDKKPLFAAKQCERRYPVLPLENKVIITERIDTVLGEPEVVYVNCDSNKGIVTVPIPVIRTIYKTVTKDSIVTVEDSKKLSACHLEFADSMDTVHKREAVLQDNFKRIQHGRSNWRLWFLILAGYTALRIGLRIASKGVVSWLP